MSNIKKLIAGVSAAVIGISSAFTASALEWKVTGYDTSVLEKEAYNTYRVGVVYEQFDDNGLSTGAVVGGKGAELYGLKPYAKVSFSAPAFERSWPNREYVSVFADGNDTGKVFYTGAKENLSYRTANYMWELATPHRIYNRKQALIYGNWYTDDSYPVEYAGDVATVRSEYANSYGFGYWHIQNGGTSVTYMPKSLQKYANVDTNIYCGNYGVATNALAFNAVTDLTGARGMILDFDGKPQLKIKKTFSLEVAGPKFNFDGSVTPGNEFALAYSAATAADANDEKALSNFAVEELVKHIYSHDGSCAYANVEWVDAGFEPEKPYRYYQLLKVDNVVLDGRIIVKDYLELNSDGTYKKYDIRLPKVYRYLIGSDGNYATANVTSTFTASLFPETSEYLVDDLTETVYQNNKPFVTHIYYKDK